MFRETSYLIFAAALALTARPPSSPQRSSPQQPLSARDAFYSASGLVVPPKPAAPAKRPRRSSHATTITAGPPSVGAPAAPAASAASSAVASAGPLGLRYSILEQMSDGRASEVDPDSVFRSGDRIRLSIEANDTAHLYIVQRGSSGNWSLLFPSPEISGGENLIERGKQYEIPAGHWFAFDEQPGTEKLFIVLSRGPQPDLEKMIYVLRDSEAKPSKTLLAEATRSIDDAVVGKIRSQVTARDLIFEKVDENAGDQKEKAVYVVNKSGGAESSVAADVSLNHK